MAKSVFRKDEAESIAVVYNPRKFPAVISSAAHQFVAFQAQKTDETGQPSFRIDRVVAETTGVAELERASIEERVEREALARLKDLQEQAYQKAYQLGLKEGREKAFTEQKMALEERLGSLDTVLKAIESIKSELVAYNEVHMMNLIFQVAKKLLMDEISQRREVVLDVVKRAIESAQSDENVVVRVSHSDFEFVESVREKLGKEFDSLKQVKFESADELTDGGCVVETNYGDVDARVEMRVDKLWAAISEKLPKIKEKIGG
jgi:flagellar assembly protein FliH